MGLLYEKFVNETFDANGVLKTFEVNAPDNFNYGFDVVDELARTKPDKKALIWCNAQGEEKTFTFDDIRRMSNKTANFFKSKGIGKGDKVMLVLKRHYEWWFCMLALHKLGAVCIPATNLLTKKDYVYRFNAADIKMVICTCEGEVADHVDSALADSPSLKTRVIVHQPREGWEFYDEGIAEASDEFPRPEGAEAAGGGDMMLMYFTSGTSGLPKMVAHDFTYPLGHIITAKHWQNVNPEGCHLTVADTGWGKAVWGKLYGQWLAETAIFVYDYDKFVPAELLHIIETHKVTTFCAPPTIYRFFIQEDLSRFDLSSLQYATIAGEALNPEVFDRFKKATGIKLMEGFGQTETTCTVLNLVGTNPKPGSMGKPSPLYRAEIVDDDMNPVDCGVVGEIVLRTDKKQIGLFMEYYRDEERTKSAWHDGYYHTGDLAWKDEDGYFWYVGRKDDIIKSSGYRIGPFEVESVLMEHPAVVECAITGVPDPIRGQVVKATIVLAAGYTASDELKKEIQNYVKKNTAPYKYPRVVEFVTELPKTISGKIRRVEIRTEDHKNQ